MEYDNNNTGVVFERKNAQQLVGTGNLTEDGKSKRIAIIEDVMPDGRTIRDIYVNVGRLWDNNNENPNAPQFTGLCETSNGEKRIAAWVKDTENGKIFLIQLKYINVGELTFRFTPTAVSSFIFSTKISFTL